MNGPVVSDAGLRSPVDLASTDVSGMLPTARGGTGNSSGGLLPNPSGHAGQFLATDGVAYSWQPMDGGTF